MVAQKAKSRRDSLIVGDGCVLMWIWMMVLGGIVWFLPEDDLALDPQLIPIDVIVFLIVLCLNLLIFPAVGAYVGYRTRAPGWLTGGLPSLMMASLAVLFDWFATKAVNWSAILYYLVLVVLGMAGGWIGGWLRKRRLVKAQEAEEAAACEVAEGAN